MPTELDELQRRVMQLEIEETALKQEKDDPSKRRLEALRKELADAKEQATALRAVWSKEKESLGRVQKVREELEAARLEMAKAERNYDLNKIAELKHGRIPQLEKELAKAEKTRHRQDHAREGGGLLRGDRRDHLEVDPHPALQAAPGREGEAPEARGRAAHARHRPGRGRAPRQRGHSPRRAGIKDPQPADRQLPLPRAHRRRQDRARQDARRAALRLRGQPHPPRHVRIHGKAQRRPHDRGAPGLCRL
jgi:hypothetical protein